MYFRGFQEDLTIALAMHTEAGGSVWCLMSEMLQNSFFLTKAWEEASSAARRKLGSCPFRWNWCANGITKMFACVYLLASLC